LTGATLGLVVFVYLFVILIDPWNVLPLAPPLPRVPNSGNARYSFPALARSPDFDSILLGTSTTRLLQPAQLDPLFHARFANLAMNSATAWEQMQLLRLFIRAHPNPRAILIGLDAEYCRDVAPETTSRPFPRWMYSGSSWAAYREMLTPYAVQESANQFAVMIGLHRRRYGLDGYTSFVPDDAAYDPARVDAAFARWPAADSAPAVPDETFRFPAHDLLADGLRNVPPGTKITMFFPPASLERQAPPGTRDAARWAACKTAITQIAPAATVIDFMIPSDVTTGRANYWDPLHYRAAVAARIGQVLAGGTDPMARRL